MASTSQSANPQAAQHLLESGGAAFSQQLLGSGSSCSQGLEGSCSDEAEMVLNLSTQIGLNLTRKTILELLLFKVLLENLFHGKINI